MAGDYSGEGVRSHSTYPQGYPGLSDSPGICRKEREIAGEVSGQGGLGGDGVSEQTSMSALTTYGLNTPTGGRAA
jgi:hypothetical protein